MGSTGFAGIGRAWLLTYGGATPATGWSAMIRDVMAYDIAYDRPPEDAATLLLRYGIPIQLSLFESDLHTRGEPAALRAELREVIDPVDDQVRLYPLADRAAWQVAVIRAGHLGTPGFLDRGVTRYNPDTERPFSVMVGAQEPAGQRPAVLDQGYRSGRHSMVGAGTRKTPGYEALHTASVAKPSPKPRA